MTQPIANTPAPGRRRAPTPVLSGGELPPASLPDSTVSAVQSSGDPLAGDRLAQRIASHLADLPAGAYVSTRLEARLEPEEAEFLAQLREGLNRSAARLPNGRNVETTAQALRWLLGTLAAATATKSS